MDCRDARRSLSLLADERLGTEEIGTLEEHLGTCADCARFARTVEEVQSWFANLSCPPAPPDLAERVLLRLGEPGARFLALRPLLQRTVAAAAILFVVTGSAALFTGAGATPDPAMAGSDVRLTADGALDWIMAEIARDSVRIEMEERR